MRSFDEELASALSSFSNVVEFTKMFFDSETAKNKARTIRRYVSGDTIPSYETARDLCTKLGIEYTEEELLASLELAKENKSLRGEKYYDPHLIKKCNVKSKDAFKGQGLTPADKEKILLERVKETTQSNTISEYVRRLIELDGNHRILPTLEEKEGN